MPVLSMVRVVSLLGAVLAGTGLVTRPARAQGAADNPRLGRWLLESTAPAPARNLMTYERDGASGMKVTVESVSARGDTTRWWYTTQLDGTPMPVTGNASVTHAAVRRVSPTINEIVNLKDGQVTQRLTNVLSPDHRTIAVIYMRAGVDGGTGAVTFAVYRRVE